MQVSDEERGFAKQLAYGLLYGMGIAALADKLKVSPEKAKQLHQEFETQLPGLFKWKQSVITLCKCALFASWRPGCMQCWWPTRVQLIPPQGQTSSFASTHSKCCQG